MKFIGIKGSIWTHDFKNDVMFWIESHKVAIFPQKLSTEKGLEAMDLQ